MDLGFDFVGLINSNDPPIIADANQAGASCGIGESTKLLADT